MGYDELFNTLSISDAALAVSVSVVVVAETCADMLV